MSHWIPINHHKIPINYHEIPIILNPWEIGSVIQALPTFIVQSGRSVNQVYPEDLGLGSFQ